MALEYRNTRTEPISEQLRRGREEIGAMRSDANDIFGDLATLLQKEMELARAEVAEAVGFTRNGAIFGVATAILGGLLLTFAAITLLFVLDTAMPTWAAALVTTLIIGALTAICGYIAYASVKQISVVPKRTMQSLNEDVRWARNQMNFNAR